MRARCGGVSKICTTVTSDQGLTYKIWIRDMSEEFTERLRFYTPMATCSFIGKPVKLSTFLKEGI